MTRWIIRVEKSEDSDAISRLVEEAFHKAEHSDGNEAAIISQLREDGELALSLVAESKDDILGHISFSAVAITDGSEGWFGLGPLSVSPPYQGKGIGSALTKAGLEKLRTSGATGCVVLGDPAYYSRFGFRPDPQLTYPGPPAEYFMQIRFSGPSPRGRVTYRPAFG